VVEPFRKILPSVFEVTEVMPVAEATVGINPRHVRRDRIVRQVAQYGRAIVIKATIGEQIEPSLLDELQAWLKDVHLFVSLVWYNHNHTEQPSLSMQSAR
jgi:hypothetical protein